jgi:hypothetical protein
MDEEWRDIEGFPGYKVSSLSRIRGSSGRIMTPYLGKRGYYIVNIHKDRKQHTIYVHRAVALAFIPNPESKPFADHIDRDRTNNSISNLRWATKVENCLNNGNPNNYIIQTFKVNVPGHPRREFKNLEEAIAHRDLLLANLSGS